MTRDMTYSHVRELLLQPSFVHVPYINTGAPQRSWRQIVILVDGVDLPSDPLHSDPNRSLVVLSKIWKGGRAEGSIYTKGVPKHPNRNESKTDVYPPKCMFSGVSHIPCAVDRGVRARTHSLSSRYTMRDLFEYIEAFESNRKNLCMVFFNMGAQPGHQK